MSEGNVNDSLLFSKQILGINLENVVVLADRAYSTYEVVESFKAKGATVYIPPKANMKIVWNYDKGLYCTLLEKTYRKIETKNEIKATFQNHSDRANLWNCEDV